MYTHNGPPLYVTADRTTVVPAGDPRAAYLLIVDGATMSDEDAERWGLTGDAAKAKAEKAKDTPPPNKAKADEPPNKAKG
jgi:hypothetical protein